MLKPSLLSNRTGVMMNPLIIKLGGVLLDSEEALERLFTALVQYREAHQRPLVIVHGGGCVVDELMKQ
ncbi:amino acid kinase family protein, partial [Nocardia farcinica]|uniref:amino acid kinase family protein n=1 Tax=Nocardia farcinica TaxID=37329 RepID=UPI002B4AE59A